MGMNTKYEGPKRTGSGDRFRVVARRGEESLTKQSAKSECDVNLIVKRFQKTGSWSHVSTMQAAFGDVSEVGDYQTMLSRIDGAMESFMRLPAAARKRFDNDPGKMLDFMADPANADEAVKLGLMVKREVAVEAPAGVATPSVATPAGAGEPPPK